MRYCVPYGLRDSQQKKGHDPSILVRRCSLPVSQSIRKYLQEGGDGAYYDCHHLTLTF